MQQLPELGAAGTCFTINSRLWFLGYLGCTASGLQERIVRSAMEGLDIMAARIVLCSPCQALAALQRRTSWNMVGIIGNHWNLRFFPQLSIIKALASPTSTLSELFTTRMSPLPQ